MLRSPLQLAALAHAAAPRLRPVSVHGLDTTPGARYQVAQVVTDDDQVWDVKVALSAAAGAALEQSDALTRLLTKRLPYAVPHLEGITVAKDGAIAAVMPHLPGHAITWRSLEPRGSLARSVGAALAVLHDVDPRVVEEAGLPAYDADSYRARKLARLDRAATTGRVPSTLLSRWERALEEVTLWRFATCTTHGPLESVDVLVDGDVVAVTGWEAAGVSDPAEDFAPLFALAPTEAFDTVLEAYAGARHEPPDPHLSRRIRLASELHRVTALLDALAADDEERVARRTAALQHLDQQTRDDEGLLPPTPGRRKPPADQPPEEPVDPAEIRVVDPDSSGEDETIELPVGGTSTHPDSPAAEDRAPAEEARLPGAGAKRPTEGRPDGVTAEAARRPGEVEDGPDDAEEVQSPAAEPRDGNDARDEGPAAPR